MKKQVGVFTADILRCLPSVKIKEHTPIYLGDTNLRHMQTAHPADYEAYGADIEQILSAPDYIGCNKRDDSIEFVKEYFVAGKFVKVAVRVSGGGTYYVRSLYTLNNTRVNHFIQKGTLVKVEKTNL